MLGELVNYHWTVRQRQARWYSAPAFTANGLTLGAGTRLAQDTDGDDDRMSVLLEAAYGIVKPDVVGQFRRALARWEAGEAALAHIHLAQSGLPRLATSDQAFRLFLAETMLDAGLPATAVRKAFRGGFTRYWEDEARVPAGHHRQSGRWTTGAIIVAGGDNDADHTPPRKDKDPTDEGRRDLGVESPEQALAHGKPIEPGLAGVPFAPETVLLGNNAKQGGGRRYNTDLPGGRAEAEKLFRSLTAGQPVATETDDDGNIMHYTPDRTQLRIKSDGSIRLDRPITIDEKNRETIHFKDK